MTTRESFFAAAPRPKVQSFEVEGFGPVHVRPMNAGELGAFEEWMAASPKSADALAKVATVGLCDESGSLLFGPEDLAKLGELDPKFLLRIQELVIKVNGLGPEDVAALEKKADPPANSGSAS